MRILLVEDSAAQRLVLLRMLERLGHEVTAVCDAETALSLHGSFDALVTDLALPGIGGEALIAALHPDQGAGMVFVAMSASYCTVAGADVVLTKPVLQAQLACALAGDTLAALPPPMTRLDARQIAGLQRELGRDRVKRLIARFIAEADGICARAAPDSMAMHHLAGAAALFGALALQTAALAGNVQAEWPQTRAILLELASQLA